MSTRIDRSTDDRAARLAGPAHGASAGVRTLVDNWPAGNAQA